MIKNQYTFTCNEPHEGINDMMVIATSKKSAMLMFLKLHLAFAGLTPTVSMLNKYSQFVYIKPSGARVCYEAWSR
jgi:hypothetical protein